MPIASLSFVSSVQRGLAAGHAREDDPAQNPVARAPLKIEVNFIDSQKATTTLTLVGPGDIVGLDPRAVTRTYPRRDDNDAEFQHFAMVELDQADLPWRYTPARPRGDVAASTDRLRPWLSLVVLEETADFTEQDLTPASLLQKLPILKVSNRHLPHPEDAWAWSHLQTNEELNLDPTQIEGQLVGVLEGAPGRYVARIMSPRILKPQKAYRAFLVPTFKRGQLVGTGGAPGDVDGLAAAWEPFAGTDVVVELPVYYDWRFQTGTAGSFEALASALAPRTLPSTVGRRDMDVKRPGLSLPSPAAPEPGTGENILVLSGALQSLAARAAQANDPAPTTTWVDGLRQFVDVSEIEARDEDGVVRMVKVVTPPLYGRWYAGRAALLPTPPWFFQLNSDPRHRVPAALGTQVIQNEQQSLMESAWRQIDQLRTVNYERKVLQIGREAYGRFMVRHVRLGFTESQLSLTGRLHGRLLAGNRTVWSVLAGSALGRDFFDPQWRRLASPRGLIGRRVGLPNLVGPPNIYGPINDGTIQLNPPPPPPPNTLTPPRLWGPLTPGGASEPQITDLANRLGKDQLVFWGLVLWWTARQQLAAGGGELWWLLHKLLRFGLLLLRLANDPGLVRHKLREALRGFTLTGNRVSIAPPAPGFTVVGDIAVGNTPVPTPGAPGPDSAQATVFRAAAVKLIDHLRRTRLQPTLTKVNLPGLLATVMDGLEPRSTLPESLRKRLTIDGSVGWNNTEDLLEPIQAAPEFDRPMYEPLRQISDEWILPGLAQVPQDTTALVVTNQRFVEAYMTGLNHEMTRELVWNEYPTDQRGTYFRQFWDPRGFLAGPGSPTHTAESLRDINPIRQWPAGASLGDNSSRPGVGSEANPRVVLLVRGQLIKRYPNVIVYVATAAIRPDIIGSYQERHPVFSGFLGGDVAYYGFDLTVNEATGTAPPWFFILQEQPAEPRFGVPLGDLPGLPADLENARPAGQFAGNGTAAQVAVAGFRQPFRVAIKGSALLNPPPSP